MRERERKGAERRQGTTHKKRRNSEQQRAHGHQEEVDVVRPAQQEAAEKGENRQLENAGAEESRTRYDGEGK
jgi:hypothetical protein